MAEQNYELRPLILQCVACDGVSLGLALTFPEEIAMKQQLQKSTFKNGHEQNGLKLRRSMKVLAEQDSECVLLNYRSFVTNGGPIFPDPWEIQDL